MSHRHTLNTHPDGDPSVPYFLGQTDKGYQTTVRDLMVKVHPIVIGFGDDDTPIYGEPEPCGTFWGVPIYTYPGPIVYRDNYRPKHARRT